MAHRNRRRKRRGGDEPAAIVEAGRTPSPVAATSAMPTYGAGDARRRGRSTCPLSATKAEGRCRRGCPHHESACTGCHGVDGKRSQPPASADWRSIIAGKSCTRSSMASPPKRCRRYGRRPKVGGDRWLPPDSAGRAGFTNRRDGSPAADAGRIGQADADDETTAAHDRRAWRAIWRPSARERRRAPDRSAGPRRRRVGRLQHGHGVHERDELHVRHEMKDTVYVEYQTSVHWTRRVG